jgi:zinc/manganese transport system substrate-binding protein
MKKYILIFFFATSSVMGGTEKPLVQKKLNVVATMPVVAAIAREVGGDKVDVKSLVRFDEDPHSVMPRPTLQQAVKNANVFLQIGRSLEIWVPNMVKSYPELKENVRLFTISKGAKMLEIPNEADRKKGDIHPQGNPHLWLSPSAALQMAINIRDALVKVNPENRESYERNFISFKEKLTKKFFGEALAQSAKKSDDLWLQQKAKTLNTYAQKQKKAIGGWLKEAAGIDYPFLSYHTVFSYLADEFGLKVADHIEETNAIQPVNALIAKAKSDKIKHVVAANYYKGRRLLKLVADQVGAKLTLVAVDCEPNQSYFDFMDQLLRDLNKLKN